MITTIGIDGDDTLWHFEGLFTLTQERFAEMLAPYGAAAIARDRLLATERRNLSLFGYGVKGFTLSMIESAIELTDSRVAAGDIQRLIDAGKAMLAHPIDLLPGVDATLEALRGAYRLVLITKGDLFDQESKIARSGVAEMFDRIAIVSEKDEAVYARILAEDGVKPEAFLMVGNSVRSDILPVLAIGGSAAHIPYDHTWEHEKAEIDEDASPAFHRLESIDELPALLARLNGTSSP